MNNFELYKLKTAGITNLGLNKILSYIKKNQTSPSLKEMIRIASCKHPSLVLERYKSLDKKLLLEEFKRFPSFSILDQVYPEELKAIYNPPVLLFYQGTLELLEKPKLAVVGARKSSQVGSETVKKLLAELNQNFVIVSGLARGIDTAAHMATLKQGGKTIAVVGNGLSQYYPKENRPLQDYISKNHLILSEYGPDSSPKRHHFPERNRIIAGLSLGVLVVEAKIRSGSLITCERALEEGRDVFAVPGNILDGNSEGCHHLIKEGAKCVTTGLDILSEYHF